MYVVYAIRSTIREWIYVGMTNNIDRRLVEHNTGTAASTKAFKPFELIYKEEVASSKEARVREKYWKSGVGKERLKRML